MAKERSMVLREELKQFSKNSKKEMKQLYEMIKQHPLTCLISIIVIVTAVVLLIALPYWRVIQFGIADPKDLAEMENSYRTTLAQVLGGIAVGIGIYFAWGNLTTAREGQITDRFTRAVDQLGSEKLEIRLGGIYALERIANESEKDYWPIIEVLTTYVRMNSEIDNISTDIQEKGSIIKGASETEIQRISVDIQTVLTVLGRRKFTYNNGESENLNLTNTYLDKAELEGAHLEGAYINLAHLKGATLDRAHLEGVHLVDANLDFAWLEGTHLEQADLRGSSMKRAKLTGAYLLDAHLEGANLEHTVLEKAHLNRADLILTCLKDAYLPKVDFREANLVEANFRGAWLEDADLRGTNLEEADFEGAILEGASFIGTKNLKIDQLSKAKTLYNAKLDEGLEKLLKEKYPTLFEKTRSR